MSSRDDVPTIQVAAFQRARITAFPPATAGRCPASLRPEGWDRSPDSKHRWLHTDSGQPADDRSWGGQRDRPFSRLPVRHPAVECAVDSAERRDRDEGGQQSPGQGIQHWTNRPIYYIVTATELLVRAAVFRWRIPLDQIIEVYPTHNPLSSPALSLDRLRVNYKRPSGKTWWVMISPKEKEQFLDDLAKAAGLEKDGNRLVRRN